MCLEGVEEQKYETAIVVSYFEFAVCYNVEGPVMFGKFDNPSIASKESDLYMMLR